MAKTQYAEVVTWCISPTKNVIPGITMSPKPSIEYGRATTLVGKRSWRRIKNVV